MPPYFIDYFYINYSLHHTPPSIMIFAPVMNTADEISSGCP